MDKTELTISAYNDSAQVFAARFMDFETYRNKLYYFQCNYLNNCKSILDLGCGPGNISKLLFTANNTYQIMGLDLSEKMVDLAKHNVPNGTFIVCDIRNFNLNTIFDAAIASFCIVHLTHDEAAFFLKNTCGHLASGGYLYLTFMEGSGSSFERTCFSEKELFFNYFQRSEVVKILMHCSMTIEEIFEETYVEKNGEEAKDIFIIAKSSI